MGAWGVGVLQDDFAKDVHSDYIDGFNAGRDRNANLHVLTEQHRQSLADDDEAPLFWLAVAQAQWDCGQLDPDIANRVKQWVAAGADLSRWEESGPAQVRARRKALDSFLQKIESPRPVPKKPRKPIKRKPLFAPGDCLAIRLSDGDYGALLVLDSPPEIDDPTRETYGINHIGQLRYKSPQLPTIDVFEKREWLRLTHHNWGANGASQINVLWVMKIRFKDALKRISVVGRVPLREDEPTPRAGAGWGFEEQVILQAKWDEQHGPALS